MEVVWDLSHVDGLPASLIDHAVKSHLDILTQSQYVTDQIRNVYIDKCIQDITDGVWVVPAIRHLQNNLEAMLKQPYSKYHKVSFLITETLTRRYYHCCLISVYCVLVFVLLKLIITTFFYKNL